MTLKDKYEKQIAELEAAEDVYQSECVKYRQRIAELEGMVKAFLECDITPDLDEYFELEELAEKLLEKGSHAAKPPGNTQSA